jgi:hypothetical protein
MNGRVARPPGENTAAVAYDLHVAVYRRQYSLGTDFSKHPPYPNLKDLVRAHAADRARGLSAPSRCVEAD